MTESSLRKPLLTYMHVRSALYAFEGLLSPLIDVLVNKRRPRLLTDDPDLLKASLKERDKLLEQDAKNILEGVYPLTVLKPEHPLRHIKRLPKMFYEGLAIAKRRKAKKAHEFRPEFADTLSELPEYYRRNFHFQGDGYLSNESAELYDHQVDVLFAGTADAMRRLVLAPLKERFGACDGEGLKFLEIGAGSGNATQFVRLAFPKARIVALDLSEAYLDLARRRLRTSGKIDFIQGKGEQLRFKDASFDAVYSVFLFHELPEDVRETVIQESMRVLKTGGELVVVDSLQKGDVPELDPALESFPHQFHEPFYKNYSLRPLEKMVKKFGLRKVKVGTGFFSKVVSGQKSPHLHRTKNS